MKGIPGILLFLLLFTIKGIAQHEASDSALLQNITVRAFNLNRQPLTATAAIRLITPAQADRYNKTSLVSGLNSVAGVRMEERSPGSYRINIRGSSLRSPFGVRNVKVYWNDIPLTDAGGNTYFNQLAINNFSSIELFKGPPGGLYGAGTGGLILLNSFDNWSKGISAEYMTGSYGLQNVLTAARLGNNEQQHQLTFTHNQHKGYREQSAMRRDNFSWSSQYKFSDKQQLSASFLFTDLYYQTPGALTAAEFAVNRKAARPAAGGFPSATDAKAAIFQKNITAGFTHAYAFNNNLKNTTTLYAAFANLKNAAVRNYERRSEPQWGARSLWEWSRIKKQTEWRLTAGGEFQQGFFNTRVAQNRNGNPDTVQTNDDIDLLAYSLFAQADISVSEKWFITAGASINQSRISFTRLSNYPVIKQRKQYQAEWMPRIAVLRKMTDNLSLLGVVSKGFSPPTTAELLPSTGIISTDLEAERGWNYELTARYQLPGKKLSLEATGFYFHLKDALVQRRDMSGADFFINAGDVKQRGIELQADYMIISKGRLFDYFIARPAYTWHHFRYHRFEKNGEDFSGNALPSVPAHSFSLLLDLHLQHGFYLSLTGYTASSAFLNDANTAKQESYTLMGGRLGWKKQAGKKTGLHFYLGADNLFDESYSLGNDINAAAGRYFNAAPGRNFYAGISFSGK